MLLVLSPWPNKCREVPQAWRGVFRLRKGMVAGVTKCCWWQKSEAACSYVGRSKSRKERILTPRRLTTFPLLFSRSLSAFVAFCFLHDGHSYWSHLDLPCSFHSCFSESYEGHTYSYVYVPYAIHIHFCSAAHLLSFFLFICFNYVYILYIKPLLDI